MKKKLHFLFFLMIFSGILQAQQNTNPRAEWFTGSRFGMFIHWGVYSGAEGYWKGEKLRNDNDYAEWIMYRNRIDKNEYVTLLERFDWDRIDPEEWVLLAKRSGMKYVTLTAKHHDGFALWDSKVGNFDLGDYTHPARDIVKELSEACKKHGLKMGLYYSHWVDWEHEYGWDHNKELTGISPEEYDRYWQEKVIPQMRELLTGYGEIGLFWFDMWIHHSQTVVTREQLLQLKGLIRELQPGCLVNSRLGLSVEEDPDIDFKTLGDNQLGSKKEEFPWQSPATVAHSWGYHASDREWKSTSTLLRSLINNVSLNGNFMLNIGPRANGDVPWEITQRMLEMGRWLEVNGESVYGAGAADLPKDQHDWGKITLKKTETGTNLYLHVFNWPLNKKLVFTGIKTIPRKIWALSDKKQEPLKFIQEGSVTTIFLPEEQPDPYVSVIVAEYDSNPESEQGLAAITSDGGYSLHARNIFKESRELEIIKKERNGTVPEHVLIGEPVVMTWKIYVETPGEKTVDLSYSYQGENSGGEVQVEIAGKKLSYGLVPTGKTVGEPNQNWVIDQFRSVMTGKVYLQEKGLYEVVLKVNPARAEAIRFQWLWIR